MGAGGCLATEETLIEPAKLGNRFRVSISHSDLDKRTARRASDSHLYPPNTGSERRRLTPEFSTDVRRQVDGCLDLVCAS